ncbi:hypothetical protein [Allohahella sp. A8]|uniref:hypothetical protein n=1 Tax=Allohahella sp. A8 TaxID=3141461 RepID=UPI003A80DFD5
MANNERTLQQVKLPKIVQDALKDYAKANNLTLNDSYDAIFEWFLKYRSLKTTFFYFACPMEGDYKSMWPSVNRVEKIKSLAKKDKTQVNRVVFTAIVLFLQEHRKL